MPQSAEDLLRAIAESDEVDIETQRAARAPAHRTTIWIVSTVDGVFVRSFKGKKGRWYQEAVANPVATIYRGRRKVRVKVEPETNSAVIRRVSAAYREKYGERWPDETAPMVRRSVLSTTLRLTPA